jgi:hypothetical protein
MAISRLTDLYEFLEGRGYEVYFPGQKVGECKKPYVVIKDEGLIQVQQFSSDFRLYGIMCFVPLARFADLEVMVDQLKDHMKELYPFFVSTRNETPSFLDEAVKAHMISVQYRISKKFYHK